jgi:aconitate hydratase
MQVSGSDYTLYSLKKLMENGHPEVARLPLTLKVLLENLLRFEDGKSVTKADVNALIDWLGEKKSTHEIAFRPARVLMQDFTGVPAVVDLAAMRDAMAAAGGDVSKINPQVPVDLIIDHSVMADRAGDKSAFRFNVDKEMERNFERYAFLRWGQLAFDNFRVVPPGTGICHQVNLEYLGRTVWVNEIDGEKIAYPDSLVGTDSHTTMINGLAVLGWGVGGIEAEAAMLGQPVSMLIPEVVGFRLSGALREGVTATDLVLTVTKMMREFGVVGKFVEFFGNGLAEMALADRATIANMSPEFGATCAWFPIDQVTLDYLTLTGRSEENVALVDAYAKEQGLWRYEDAPAPEYSAVLELDLDSVVPSLAGPKRPQDHVTLQTIRTATEDVMTEDEPEAGVPVDGTDYALKSGDVVIAAITSCTNTSNPRVMIAAGLVAKKALELGVKCKPWVKTSLAPGSKVVTAYLEQAGLQTALNKQGFNLVGYGCTTCIGNSGPLDPSIDAAIQKGNLTVSAVLSGNRNFEGRVHSQTKANWLASPPLVVAYALAGTTRIDLSSEPLGTGSDGQPVYLKDVWPSNAEVTKLSGLVRAGMFREQYSDLFSGDDAWQKLPVPEGGVYDWQTDSTYVQQPDFFAVPKAIKADLEGFAGAKILALLGDSITTDHISPAGAIMAESPAGRYLQEKGVAADDFNSYGSRRGNFEVMVRGTFANIRLRNEMVPETEGGYTRHIPTGDELSIFDAAMRYRDEQTPLVIVAGKEYGSGSSRDWAAKGTLLLGVKAVLAESFERIHRSNLLGMGILPLQFKDGMTRKSLDLDGSETIDLKAAERLVPTQDVTLIINRSDGSSEEITALCRIDTVNEVAYYNSGGILNYVLYNMLHG